MTQTSQPKTRHKWFLYVITLLITLLLAFLIFSYFSKTYIFAEEQRSSATNYTYPMDEIIVNLKDGSRYFKAELALGYNLDNDQELIIQNEVQVRDTLLSIFRSKSVEDIMPIENTEELKSEIQDKLNKLFPENIITDIFFTDFLIQ